MENIFQERLRKAMFLTGIRQADLVAKTGIDKGAISSYVHGRYKPNAEAMSKLAEALSVPTDWLLGKDDFPAAEITRTTFAPSCTGEEISLVRAYRKADDTKRQIVRLTLGL